MINAKMLRRLGLQFLGIACTGVSLAQPIELEAVSKSESAQMTLVQAAGALSTAEIDASLDPNDCDPYMHTFIVSSGECIKVRRGNRPYKEVRPTSETKVICRLSKRRYYNITGPVDENAPCYGKANGQILRGDVIVF